MFCKSCGAPMEESFNVCQSCGTKKGLGASFCDKCGAVRQVGMAFCQECGNKLDDQPATVQGNVPYSQQTTAQQYNSVAQMDNSQYLPPKKFCRNCGKQVQNNQAICTACGFKVGMGNSFCPHCASPTQLGVVVCTNCGQSLQAVNVGAFFKEFSDSFTSVFKLNIKDMLIDFGSYFVTVITFILCLVPCVEVSASIWGYTESESMNIFQIDRGFVGFLFILALAVSVARFVPQVIKFIETNVQFGKYYVLVAPALMAVGLLLTIISVLNGASAASEYAEASAYGLDVSCHFTFGGWLFIIFNLAGIASGVLSFLRKENIIVI